MEQVGTLIGSYAPDFELPGVDDTVHHLVRYLEQHQAVGVVFMCNHCPYVKLYLDRLKQVQTEFQPQGFTLIGINANDANQFPEDSFDRMKVFATEHQLNFPYLRDVTQDVAASFGAEKTPHLFLLNRAGILCYKGRVDAYPNDPLEGAAADLRSAISQVLNQQSVMLSVTEPIGCSVKWRV